MRHITTEPVYLPDVDKNFTYGVWVAFTFNQDTDIDKKIFFGPTPEAARAKAEKFIAEQIAPVVWRDAEGL